MPPRETYYGLESCKLAKLQQVFPKNRDFALFLQANQLSKTLESVLEQRTKQQELYALDQANLKATLAKPLHCRTDFFGSSAT